MSAAVALVNEGTSHFVVLTFVDHDGLPVVPLDVYIRIDDFSSGESMRVETAETSPAAEMTIEITPAENNMINERMPHEKRVMTITATYGTGGERQVTGEYVYKLVNLRFRNSPISGTSGTVYWTNDPVVFTP